MKRAANLSGANFSKRITRSVDVADQTDIHPVAEFAKSLPQVLLLRSYDGLRCDEPAQLCGSRVLK